MAGAIALLGATSCAAALAIGFASVGAAAATSQRAASAADAAALAAADAVSGAVDGDPCERAAEVAAAVGAHVVVCRLDGPIVTISVSIPVGPLVSTATARAGPRR